MSDSKDPTAQELGLLEEEELKTRGTKFFARDLGFRHACGLKNFAGNMGCSSLVLLFLFFMFLAAFLVTILVQVFKFHSSLEQEQSRQEEIYQEVTQLKAEVDRLCRPCPWDWAFFQGNCYFFSKIQRNWHDSMTACQEVGAQLVVIKSTEEQDFLQLQTSESKHFSWMGLSDLTHEGTWQWVDGSPLQSSFMNYWDKGEPNNIREEDCVEFGSQGWNDLGCHHLRFWNCKKSATSCQREEVQ
uniref:C-type lectin domain-containing protein n=2 Tax=Otolemur garnettii TaxID=30611 RepID=H0XUL8_OTOGA